MQSLPDGYIDLPPGKLANVVTALEMRVRPAPRQEPAAFPGHLEAMGADPVRYRALFHRVGDEYLWFSRLTKTDAELERILSDPLVEAYALRWNGSDEGLLELDFRVKGEAEIVFFGVTDRLLGSGAGRWLMNRALERAWARPIDRLWVHTCTLDHPAAVPFYVKSGFVPFKRQMEIGDDPRAMGLVPRTAAPHVPLL